ncbi:hypothetical protein AB8880_11110 [Alphaproteobacteria bacterium LSUCC0684]
MQPVLVTPARWVFRFILASLISGLAGCGGGGSTAPAPPPSLHSPLPSSLDQGQAAELMQDIEGEGPPWISLIESDSARLQLDGEDPATNAVLAKLPVPSFSSMDQIPTRYSRFQFFQSTISEGQDPGRYLLWGRRPRNILTGEASYALESHWTCLGCAGNETILNGEAAGDLRLDFDELEGDISISGDGMAITASIDLEKSYMFREGDTITLGFEDQLITLDQARITGSVFGPGGEEAGLLYGLTGGTITVTGAAIGAR